ncbi:MAG: RDD family protein [Bacteroidota bacterium]|nr:RDD family protein [Candidatus Kapabacteria bacterium]MDW8219650.1 RDD family protein [Bacteroidota bacterium]
MQNTLVEMYSISPERASFARRFVATLIDNTIIAFISITLSITVGPNLLHIIGIDSDTELSIFSDSDMDDEAEDLLQSLYINGDIFFALTVLANLTTVLYSMSELLTNASPGKRIMGIAIGSDIGEPASQALLARRWALRYGAYVLALIPATSAFAPLLHFVITCGFFMALGSERLTLHDRAVHSAVYYREDLE